MRALVAAALGFLLAAAGAAQTEAPPQADAMAFIRVVGDLRIDYRDARQPVVRKNVEVATGSGFVIAASGLVLTSRHVVESEAGSREDGPELTVESRRIQVFVGSQGSEGAWEAHVVASDEESDLAALQVTAADLPYLPFGDSDAAATGVKTSSSMPTSWSRAASSENSSARLGSATAAGSSLISSMPNTGSGGGAGAS